MYEEIIDLEEDLLDDDGMEDMFSMDIADRDGFDFMDPLVCHTLLSYDRCRLNQKLSCKIKVRPFSHVNPLMLKNSSSNCRLDLRYV